MLSLEAISSIFRGAGPFETDSKVKASLLASSAVTEETLVLLTRLIEGIPLNIRIWDPSILIMLPMLIPGSSTQAVKGSLAVSSASTPEITFDCFPLTGTSL
ncbi:hypothetical protein SDC9_108856 [bioreactor metagenome]|uniref:Uncharacterized protein n=1 Tax=bioreactor metagenome TaxID=1076179 RepID=A0A645BBF0_9ZZZZ